MDVSDREVIHPTGGELLAAVVALTGLPESQIQDELGAILSTSGVNPANLTLDDLRTAMAAYLDFVQKDLMEASPGEDFAANQGN